MKNTMTQDVNPKYHIITNSSHRRVLVIHDVVDVDHDPGLSFEDFDAIFINVIDSVMDRNKLAIRLASPLHSEKCRFKPCFVTQRLKGWLGKFEVLVDGYASTPDDTSMNRKIEEIYGNFQRLNFLLGTEPVATHAEEVVRLCRYAISRGRYTFSSEPAPGLSDGYMSLYYHTLWLPGEQSIQQQERDYFHKQLLKLGYARRTRFIERMHVCPSCNDTHLLFFESCPKCQSSDIHEEAVIHHFRCANVSPESTYQWDGELRCPKCKHLLRHIGVDYDKPSSIYTCHQCDNNFMYPDMRVLCTQEQRVWRPDQLRAVDVEEYEFTPEGIKAFANNDISHTLSHVGFYGYSSMRDFMDYLRLNAEPDPEDPNVFIVCRYYVFDPALDNMIGDAQPPLVRSMRRFLNYKQALWGNNFYFMRRVKEGEVAKAASEMEYEIAAQLHDYTSVSPGFQHEHIDTYLYHPGDNVEQFIDRLEEDRN